MNINTKWHEFQTKWFYFGLPPGTQFHMKEGIDGKTAVRHLSCIQKSFQPSHEHKVAAVAYLLSLWCNDVTFPNPDDDQAESSS